MIYQIYASRLQTDPMDSYLVMAIGDKKLWLRVSEYYGKRAIQDGIARSRHDEVFVGSVNEESLK